MKILYAASECAPFIKTGGLGDVAGTLPQRLVALGADVRVVLPRYRDIDPYWKERMQHVTAFYVNLGWRRQYCGVSRMKHQGVTYYFIDNEFYFARDAVYGSGVEEGERFAFFCRAVLELLPHVDFYPDVLHCNDWQTGMIPALLHQQYRVLPAYRNIRTLFTIHNLSYQGVFPWATIDALLGFGEEYFSPERLEFYGCISFMKGGLVFADAISTVSKTYAEEIRTPYFGEQLDGLLRKRAGDLYGILNGIDAAQYDPATNQYLEAHYTADDLSGKAVNKEWLQRDMGLTVSPDTPLIAMVSRLTQQKGIDLVEHVLDDLLRQDVQMVILGAGEERYSEFFTWAAWRYNGRLAARTEYNEGLSHRVYAGADMFLMPSRFEPCGLSQLIAMRYGAVPVVRETGGLKDTVASYNKYTDEGTGFSFLNYNAHEMLSTVERAVRYYHAGDVWTRIVQRGMRMNFSWHKSALEYARLYAALTGQVFPAPEAPPPEAVEAAEALKPRRVRRKRPKEKAKASPQKDKDV